MHVDARRAQTRRENRHECGARAAQECGNSRRGDEPNFLEALVPYSASRWFLARAGRNILPIRTKATCLHLKTEESLGFEPFSRTIKAVGGSYDSYTF